jgi:hypothetical protein
MAVPSSLQPAGLFQCVDFPNAARKPFTAGIVAHVARVQEGANQSGSQLRTDDSPTETQQVHVIVLDSLGRRIRVMANRSVHASHLVGGNARSHT